MTVGRGAVIFGCAGPRLLPEERAFYREADPFGFIVFARNIETPAQLRRLTADLREAVGRDAPVLVDQEGGRVQRLRAPHWREMRLRATVMAAELAAVGIDADCMPTLDVVRPETHPFLMNRCYGRDPETVARIGRAVAEGLTAGGVLPVMKHMPGHGLSHVDTHHDLPTVDASHAELTAVDFAPFRALADLPMAMTAHLVFAALDGERPATQSPRMIRVIREEIGFQGLLMSDDLNMQALSGTLAERTARTIAAGVDIALHCKGDMAEMVSVAGAAGGMGPEALKRAEAAVAARRPAAVDIEAALAELAHG
jgi:beta-N-acetylhexosaminidase